MTDPQTIASKLTRADRVSMPIGPGAAITCERFWMGAGHERQAQWNHGQSLTRLAERGGLDWCEAISMSVHFEPDGSLEVFADAGDWDHTFALTATTMEAGREEAFAWVRSLPAEPDLSPSLESPAALNPIPERTNDEQG